MTIPKPGPSKWQLPGSDRWMDHEEMLGLNPNIMVIPKTVRVDYGSWTEKRKVPAYQCECITSSKRRRCVRRARFRYIDVDGVAKDMCVTHLGAFGLGSMDDEYRFNEWYDKMGLIRSNQAEVDAYIAALNAELQQR